MTRPLNSLDQDVQPEKDEISKDIIMHHLNSFLDNNIEALLSDYTNESVLITQAAIYSSVDEIRDFLVGLNRHFPQKTSNLVLDKMVVKDELVFIVWHAKTPSLMVPIGSDTFIIKDGKIYRQTFVGQLNFIS